MAGNSKTAKFYRDNPDAKKKHNDYNKKYHSTPERKEYKRELSRENRKRDGFGDGKDLSHTKKGGYTMESPSTNRGRQGAEKGKPKSASRTKTKK